MLAGVLALTVGGPTVASAAPREPDLSAMLQSLPQAHNSEDKLQPNTIMMLRLIEKLWPYYATDGPIYGWREDPIADHPSGQALDIMMKDDGQTPSSVAEGNTIAGFLVANADALGVDYMMWRQQIWQGNGWSPTRDYGNWTDNHMNHIHLKVHGTAVPSGTLIAPENLSDTDLPDIASIERAYKQRIKKLKQDLATAKEKATSQSQVAAAAHEARVAAEAASKEAFREVEDLVRSTYIFGGDVDLVTEVVGMFADPVTVGSAQLVAEHARRLQIETYVQAKAAFDAAAQAETSSRDAASAASAELKTAQKALKDAQSPFKIEADQIATEQ